LHGEVDGALLLLLSGITSDIYWLLRRRTETTLQALHKTGQHADCPVCAGGRIILCRRLALLANRSL
jgi:hypothetical protein